MELAAHWADYDLGLLAARYDHFLNLSSRLINLTLRLDTTEVRTRGPGSVNYLGSASVQMILDLKIEML